jgi:HSP20 family protein
MKHISRERRNRKEIIMIWQALDRSYDPLREFSLFNSDFDRLFGLFRTGLSRGYPAVNVSAKDEEVEVQAAVPGLEPGDVTVHVEGRVLTLSNEVAKTTESEEGDTVHHQERSAGQFTRRLRLPYEVEESKVNAKLSDGVLTITLPRSAKQKPRTIPVK